MLKRLIGWTRKKPLHLRHEPTFLEQQQQIDTSQPRRPHPARRVPTLTLEEAMRQKDSSYEPDSERSRLTTLDALREIRKKESARYAELGRP